MAKTKKASTKKASSVTMRFISDPGHGWAEVPASLCKKLGIGTDYPKRGEFCYLEEDDECSQLDRALKRHKVQATFAGHEVDDFEHWLSGQQWPYIPAAVYGDDCDLVVHALESMATEMKRLCNDETYTAGERAMWRQQWADCQKLALMFSTMRGEE